MSAASNGRSNGLTAERFHRHEPYPDQVGEQANIDGKHLFVVPTSTAPLVPLSSINPDRSDVDEILDEMFGAVDDEGPGVTDAVLLTGGTAAVVASQIAAVPGGVLIGGVAALALGAVIPIRSVFRRAKASRQTRKLHGLIGDGHLMDSRPAILRGLIEGHHDVFRRSGQLTDIQQMRIRNACHGLVVEVASLLEGHQPATAVEIAYCQERADALQQLAGLIDDVAAANAQTGRVEAVTGRREVEATAGLSALADAREVASDLRSMPDV